LISIVGWFIFANKTRAIQRTGNTLSGNGRGIDDCSLFEEFGLSQLTP